MRTTLAPPRGVGGGDIHGRLGVVDHLAGPRCGSSDRAFRSGWLGGLGPARVDHAAFPPVLRARHRHPGGARPARPANLCSLGHRNRGLSRLVGSLHTFGRSSVDRVDQSGSLGLVHCESGGSRSGVGSRVPRGPPRRGLTSVCSGCRERRIMQGAHGVKACAAAHTRHNQGD